MLTVVEAQEIALSLVAPLSAERVPLVKCVGMALSERIFADRDYPAFDNAAVDGYAFRQGDLPALQVTGYAAAGSAPNALIDGEAARILTGAPIPAGADTVAMQEDCRIEGDRLAVNPAPPAGAHIRRKGEEFRQGQALLEPGTAITPMVLSLLATVGAAQPLVGCRPRVALFSTGDELYPPETQPPAGGLRDSNLPMLTALTASAPAQLTLAGRLPDDLDLTRLALARGEADVLVTCGGVSVGDRDFVRQAAEADAEVVFWKVAMKPGKPILVARYGSKLLFGLPGNPAAALVTFELFVRPVLRRLAGFARVLPIWLPVVVGGECVAGGREEYVRASLHRQDAALVATPTGLQGSHAQRSLAMADSLLRLPANAKLRAGDAADALLLG